MVWTYRVLSTLFASSAVCTSRVWDGESSLPALPRRSRNGGVAALMKVEGSALATAGGSSAWDRGRGCQGGLSMTMDASFKRVVRRHAEETGQRYTEALTDLEGLGPRMHHEPVPERLLAWSGRTIPRSAWRSMMPYLISMAARSS
jgi:hypothetical protein